MPRINNPEIFNINESALAMMFLEQHPEMTKDQLEIRIRQEMAKVDGLIDAEGALYLIHRSYGEPKIPENIYQHEKEMGKDFKVNMNFYIETLPEALPNLSTELLNYLLQRLMLEIEKRKIQLKNTFTII
jgi:hypothetical protein